MNWDEIYMNKTIEPVLAEEDENINRDLYGYIVGAVSASILWVYFLVWLVNRLVS